MLKHRHVEGSIPGRDRPEFYEQVVTAPLRNTQQKVSVADPRRWPL